MFKHFHLATFLLVVYALLIVVHSQGQTGFISLDCGLPENSGGFTEESTQLDYISDAPYINGGESNGISAQYNVNLQRWATTVRSFPDGTRNCYTITTKKGTKYLIRAVFMYGNYDGKNSTPTFELHLGPNFWDTVQIIDSPSSVVKEIIHFPLQNYVRVCLVNTGSGTPFISALELRPLKNTTYIAPSGISLGLIARMDVGSNLTTLVRYPYDAFDRIWARYISDEWMDLTTSLTVDPQDHTDFQPPNVVMQNAAMPVNKSGPFRLELNSGDTSIGYYLYMHFAELQQLKANESRIFNINVNGKHMYGPVIPSYLSSMTTYSTTPITGSLNYTFTLDKFENSTLPPIVNAIEIYNLVGVSQLETDQDDVDAMTNIKAAYGVKRNWDGDPCVPIKYLWAGLNCTNDGSDAPRITSLDLSSSGLTGEINTNISRLSMLVSLDLSNNSLTGTVPNFLSQLTNVKVLKLGNNKLTGSVPAELIQKSNDGLLSLSVEGNQDLCASTSLCKKKKKSNVVVPVVASVGGLFAFLLVAGAVFILVKTKKKHVSGNEESDDQEFGTKKRKFTYAEVKGITNNFTRVLGKGGFGTVYHGVVSDGTQVAVKVLSRPPVQASHQQSRDEESRTQEQVEQQNKQFESEVKLLMTVYHGNLTSLVGYFKEGTNMGLIYEYMANGDLALHLSGRQANVLSWEKRLEIAIDAAQGLEYLHHGCKPPIIHRDVKTPNILLNENFRAKLADFGLSRFFAADNATHVSTRFIAGTPGYLDPDITNNSWLNEKSDVYSFGVVILQIITSRPAITKTNDDEIAHISNWVQSMVANGDVKGIIDPRLQGDFDINSVWKAVEIAMACLSPTAARRPNMSQVVIELRECLASELTRRNNSRMTTDSTDSFEDLPLNTTTGFSPLAR